MAGTKIRGVTIEIGGDTTQLSKALKSVDKSLAQTQKSLTDVNRLLKFNPANTTLLKQKQELLGKQVKNTRDRLEELKKAQAEMDAQGVDKTSDQYMALQREIVATEGKLKNLQKQQREYGSIAGTVLQEVGKKLQEVGKKVTEVGKGLTKNLTAPILAVGAASLAAFNQVDEGMDIIVQKTGATGDALKELEGVAQNIATTIPTTFAEAGEAVGEVNTRFKVTGDELETLSSSFIKFAQVNNTGVTSSIDAASKTLAAFGLDAKDAAGYLDTLTRVSQNTGISVDTLQSGLLSNAAAFQEMGLSVEQAAGLMGQIELSGGDTSAVLAGLKKALKAAATDGKDMNTALQELQDSILNSTDDMDGLSKAYELFGKNGDQVFQAVKSGSLDFTALGDAAEDAGGAVDETFDNMTSPAEKWQMVMNNLMLLGYQIAEAMMPAIQGAIDTLIPIVQDLADWWNGLSEGAQGFILKAGLLVAAIGPVITVIGTVISTIGTLTTVIGTVTTAASALFAEGGMLAGLLSGPVVLGIGAAIAAGVLLWKNWDKVKEMAINVFNTVKEKWDGIKKAISDAIEGAKTAVKTGIDKIKSFFNFNFEWPKLKMPHFKISGTMNPLKWLDQGVPKISVEWYRKAKDTPYMFNNPTLIGVGDVPEVVIGADAFKRMTAAGVTNNITIVQQPGQDTNALADVVVRKITRQILATERTW